MAGVLPDGRDRPRVEERRRAAVVPARADDATSVATLRSRVITARPRDHAFDVFVRRIDGWWPHERLCAVPDRVARVQLDPWVGGQLSEVWHDGTEHPWAVVVGWRPPFEVALAWRVRAGAELTDVVLRFTEASWVTSWVSVLQSGWAALGEDGPSLRVRQRQRWAEVLSAFLWAV